VNDSIKVAIDSLAKAAIAAHDSAQAARARAATSWYEPILDHPLFKLLWPILVSGAGFLFVKLFNRREEHRRQVAEERRQRTATAERLKNFLNTAADMITALLDQLAMEGPIMPRPPAAYPAAENVLRHLADFANFRDRLRELDDAGLERETTDWHRTATASLTEVRDFRVMIPGVYFRTYARGDKTLDARFLAIQGALSADITNARDLAKRL